MVKTCNRISCTNTFDKHGNTNYCSTFCRKIGRNEREKRYYLEKCKKANAEYRESKSNG